MNKSEYGNCLKAFRLFRECEDSRMSGPGLVLEGVVFHTGQIVVSWFSDVNRSKSGASSLGFYNSLDDFYKIHCNSHPAVGSKLEWYRINWP